MKTSTQRIQQVLFILITTLMLANCVGRNATTAKSAASTDPFAAGNTLYTLTNLHPDPDKNQLYTVNFLMPGLIPRCTGVTVKDKSSERLTFTANGVDYHFDLYPSSTPEGFAANIKQYFGTSCDKSAETALSIADQKGIRDGRALLGMSKIGIIYAIGYPPNSPATPNTDAPTWKYFINRFETMNVHFSDNQVSSIKY